MAWLKCRSHNLRDFHFTRALALLPCRRWHMAISKGCDSWQLGQAVGPTENKQISAGSHLGMKGGALKF
jgi:hypothetical protein